MKRTAIFLLLLGAVFIVLGAIFKVTHTTSSFYTNALLLVGLLVEIFSIYFLIKKK